MNLNRISKATYTFGKWTRNARAVQQAIQTGSPSPVVKRLVRIGLGRGLRKAERKVGL